jgi:predicted transcriptional regulator
MPKHGKGGRPKSNRITVSVRISPEEKTALDHAAEAAGLDKSGYFRRALLTQLKKDRFQKKEQTIAERVIEKP